MWISPRALTASVLALSLAQPLVAGPAQYKAEGPDKVTGPARPQPAGPAPLSAIDWLSKSVKEKPARPVPTPTPPPGQTPVPQGPQPLANTPAGSAVNAPDTGTDGATAGSGDQTTATPPPAEILPTTPSDQSPTAPTTAPSSPPDSAPAQPEITVSRIGDVQKDAVGLLPGSISGLPSNFWGDSDVQTIAGLISKQPTDGLPALLSMLYTILLAEVDAPTGDTSGARLLLARTDKLLDLGALEQAQALLERAGPDQAEIFRRWFDVSLLTGHVDHACTAMQAAPGFAPTLQARIFCLARNGDWNAAAVTLATGETLGFIKKADADLLARFLDPGMYEGTPDLPVPSPLTPLDFAMREAIAQPRPKGALPPAFLSADLSANSPWRSEIEAAERLVRLQALTPNRLIELYTARPPAASGGIWDRVAAIQAFDVALLSGDAAEVSKTLIPAYDKMRDVGLVVPFAAHYAERLMGFALTPPARAITFKLEMLSKSYESAARKFTPKKQKDIFVQAVALGRLDGITPKGPLQKAISDAFLQPAPRGALFDLLSKGRLGEAILKAMLLLKNGPFADPGDIRTALAVFRAVGLEDTARRTAIELLLLEQRG